MKPTLTNLEFFELMIGARSYDDIWAAKGFRRAKLPIDEPEKVENNTIDAQ